MKRIQSKLHKIATYNVCKISLSCFDVKRYILSNGINNLSYFHKDVKLGKNKIKEIKSIKSIESIESIGSRE